MNLLNRRRTRVFGGAFLLWLFLMVAMPKIPHSPEHHVFADKRNFLGVPNTWNVITNYPFLIVGVLGFVICIQSNFLVISSRGERFGWALFYAGTAAKAYGSAYYHLKPCDGRFIWDTFPMMVAYSAMFSCLVIERVGERIGLSCLGVLVFLTFISSACERNLNDLRFCMMFQTIPCVAIPCVVLLSTPKYTHSKYWNWATGAYVLAKFEASSDNKLYKASRYAISGHTTEHLCSSLVPLVVTLMLMSRSIRTPPRLSDGKEHI